MIIQKELKLSILDGTTFGTADIVMVKGSNGARMGPVVARLKSMFATRDADNRAEG
jgi:hypothetical protein